MSAEHFFDDLARTLAEPMPRQRAVRLVGVSLAAIAVPGMAPRVARASTTQIPSTCPPNSGRSQCYTHPDWKPGRPDAEPYCCKFPAQQWSCGDKDNGYQCRNQCPPYNRAIRKSQQPTWSSANDRGRPKRYNCCPVPETIPRDGECLPNCPYLYRNRLALGPQTCGKTCCPSYERCVNGACKPCETANVCVSANGRTRTCCPRGTDCCFNERSTACCGPRQTCKAQGRRTATCVCDSGRRCGPDCCTRDETCCGGDECCPSGRCIGGACCAEGRAICAPTGGGPPVCCGDGEFCLWKVEQDGDDTLIPLNGTCKRGCTPGNRAGTQCCGTGYRPNRRRTACVRA